MLTSDIKALESLHGLTFFKMSGSGNDFIILDKRSFNLYQSLFPFLAQMLCSRGISIGADGLIIIENTNRVDSIFGKVDFKWHFFNADGSSATMCGNGARCAARFALDYGLAKLSFMIFDTLAGPIKAWVKGQVVKLEMITPSKDFRGLVLPELPEGLLIDGINTGVPHTVIIYKDLDIAPVKEIGKIIRFHQMFAPEGTNVNFVARRGEELWVRTYERGVEDETLACGTGAVASALMAGQILGLNSPVTVRVKSKEKLQVYFKINSTGFSDVFLEGSAYYICKGNLDCEALISCTRLGSYNLRI